MPGRRPDTLGRRGPKPPTAGLPTHPTVLTQAILTLTWAAAGMSPPEGPVKRPDPYIYIYIYIQ